MNISALCELRSDLAGSTTFINCAAQATQEQLPVDDSTGAELLNQRSPKEKVVCWAIPKMSCLVHILFEEG